MREGSNNEPTIAVFSYHALTSLINRLQYKAPHPVRIIVFDCKLKDVQNKARDMEKTGEVDVFFLQEVPLNFSPASSRTH